VRLRFHCTSAVGMNCWGLTAKGAHDASSSQPIALLSAIYKGKRDQPDPHICIYVDHIMQVHAEPHLIISFHSISHYVPLSVISGCSTLVHYICWPPILIRKI
jgi:hypothetical protein